ncbi:MFS transporter [Paraburkholderia tropica]|uniref:MFS transporter n=1 Tax=Paraburkholderia tropica TaxID=92647 RepID=UPI002AB7894A|nr:MFS transporter [Paraburkholderia tropica]
MATPPPAPTPRTQHVDADRMYRKVSVHVMPFLVISFVVAFLDRVNIGFAQFQMKHDLGFSDAIYGLAAGMFFIGYMLFEVPSNLLLHRIGAKRTFSRIMVCWGAVSIAMAFARTPTILYVLRFLLGLFEAGFFPGIVLYLSYWYPARYRASRTSWIFAAMATAGVIGGLTAGVIMTQLEAAMGLRGWQWLFIVEGFPAVMLGVIALLWLTDSPADAKWLNENERAYLLDELARDHVNLARVEEQQSWPHAFRSPALYALAFVYFTLCSITMAMNFWLPTLVKEAGAGTLANTGFLTAVPFAAGVLAIIFVAKQSDRRRERRFHYIVPTVMGCVALLVLAFAKLPLFGTVILLCIGVAGTFSALPVFWSMPHEFLSKQAAAGGLALISSVGALGAFFSPTAIGWARTNLGTMQPAMLLIILMSLAACVVVYVLLATRNNQTRDRTDTHSGPIADIKLGH